MNRILILSFAESFATSEFNDEFNVTNLDRVQALTWISESSLPEAQHFVSGDLNKVHWRSKPLQGFTFNSETYKFLSDLGAKQVSQRFRAEMSIHTYTLLEHVLDMTLGSRSRTISMRSHS